MPTAEINMQLIIRTNALHDHVVLDGRRYDRSMMSGRAKRRLRDTACRLFREETAR